MEELYESEVLWPESFHHWSATTSGTAYKGPAAAVSSKMMRPKRTSAVPTSPMSIPAAARIWELNGGGSSSSEEEDEEEEEEEEEELVPPHITVSRRRLAGKAAYSLCSGQGRTLKGRDLRCVRNAVLLMTGFLEGYW